MELQLRGGRVRRQPRARYLRLPHRHHQAQVPHPGNRRSMEYVVAGTGIETEFNSIHLLNAVKYSSSAH